MTVIKLKLRDFVAIVCSVVAFHLASASPTVKEFDIWGNGNELIQSDLNRNESKVLRNGRVLNFFPIPVEEECLANDRRRRGICMNTYECRIQGGTSFGFCAMGFGVCCVFTATCDQDIYNNITYFVNPHFPDPDINMTECRLKLKKIDEEISQIRLDFIHFNLGQPNRLTGNCDDDVFTMTTGRSKDLVICGLNNGQHLYFDVDDVDESITLIVNLSKKITSRFWEVIVTQIPFSQRAPAGCLQYHTGKTGLIRTLNFAENGRHLANQDYNI
ncbi:CUB domain [Popillia japonica]|uniref:CUB domain n=2 Tax=Popillia japonica TaxID=7064 RepID=A0AAW1IFK5_POPJA